MLEKRKWLRTACLERCEVYPHRNEALARPSRVINYSYSGIMLESETPLRRGEHVKIRLHEDSSDTSFCAIEHRLGTVRWCSREPLSFSGFFEVGIELMGKFVA